MNEQQRTVKRWLVVDGSSRDFGVAMELSDGSLYTASEAPRLLDRSSVRILSEHPNRDAARKAFIALLDSGHNPNP